MDVFSSKGVDNIAYGKTTGATNFESPHEPSRAVDGIRFVQIKVFTVVIFLGTLILKDPILKDLKDHLIPLLLCCLDSSSLNFETSLKMWCH